LFPKVDGSVKNSRAVPSGVYSVIFMEAFYQVESAGKLPDERHAMLNAIALAVVVVWMLSRIASIRITFK
jgi:hypothetical protein